MNSGIIEVDNKNIETLIRKILKEEKVTPIENEIQINGWTL
jgi:hypothetical protein